MATQPRGRIAAQLDEVYRNISKTIQFGNVLSAALGDDHGDAVVQISLDGATRLALDFYARTLRMPISTNAPPIASFIWTKSIKGLSTPIFRCSGAGWSHLRPPNQPGFQLPCRPRFFDEPPMALEFVPNLDHTALLGDHEACTTGQQP